MPSKIQLDENLWFLYICLQKSDMKAIDFSAVAIATSLKPPAARMRFTRLKRQIESGTLIGTHGTPFSEPSSSKKRSRHDYENKKEDDEDEEGDDIKRERLAKKEVGVKKEHGTDWSGDEGYNDDSWSEKAESEDEMPLAKLRKRKMMSQAHARTQVQQNHNTLPPPQSMQAPRFMPPVEMMGQQIYGSGYGGPIPVQGGMGGGQWVDYDEAARAWERTRNWHLEQVDGR